MAMKQKKIFFSQKKFKMADSKKNDFFNIMNPQYFFLQKFQGLVLGSVGEIGLKEMNVAQPMGLSGYLILGLKQTKKHKKGLFRLFKA